MFKLIEKFFDAFSNDLPIIDLLGVSLLFSVVIATVINAIIIVFDYIIYGHIVYQYAPFYIFISIYIIIFTIFTLSSKD